MKSWLGWDRLSKSLKSSLLILSLMIRCGIEVSGIDDRTIEKTFSHTLDTFQKEGHDLRRKASFNGKGYISIEGIGKDGRCAFCEYLRQALAKHIEKGAINLIKCPFNPDKAVDHSPETREARKRLVERFTRKYGSVIVEKAQK